MRRGGWRAAALGVWLALLSAPAGAEIVILRPGPEGDDTAPYSFLTSLARGGHETLYALTFGDETGRHDFESFLRFTLPPDLLGPDEEIRQSLLSLYYAIDSTGFGVGSDEPGVLECREVTGDWTEMGVTWSAKPGYGPPVDTIEDLDAKGPLLCDVTESVRAWADGLRPNRGFALTNPTGRMIGFYSFEAQVPQDFKAALFIDVVPVPELGAGPGAAAAVVALAAARARANRREGPAA